MTRVLVAKRAKVRARNQRRIDKAYNPRQPREPAGRETGGQWSASTVTIREAKGNAKDWIYIDLTDPTGVRLGSIEADNDGTTMQIREASVAEGQRGRGHGKALYAAAFKLADERGLAVRSDGATSISADRVWTSLAKTDPRITRAAEVELDSSLGKYYAVERKTYGGQEVAVRTGEPVWRRAPLKVTKAYDPNQPRDPGGPGGGQWIATGAAGSDEGEVFDYLNPPDYFENYPVVVEDLPGSMLAKVDPSRLSIILNANRLHEVLPWIAGAHKSGWISSDHPNHVIWHELAHQRHTTNLPGKAGQLRALAKVPMSPKMSAIAAKVSRYAMTNPAEFYAEFSAGKRAGRTFDADVERMAEELYWEGKIEGKVIR